MGTVEANSDPEDEERSGVKNLEDRVGDDLNETDLLHGYFNGAG